MTTQRVAGHTVAGIARAAAGALAVVVGLTANAPAHPGAPHAEPAVAIAPIAPGAARRFDYPAPRPGSYRLPVIKPATDGVVLDSTGARRTLREAMQGRITLLSFVYTRCSDARGCPLATAVLHEIRQSAAGDPALARRFKLLTLSFDIDHDRPAVLASYAAPVRAAARAAAPWEFVVPVSRSELASVLEGYGQVVEGPADGVAAPTHLLRVYLIDARQRIRNIYGADFLDARLLLSDVRTLLLEERGGRP